MDSSISFTVLKNFIWTSYRNTIYCVCIFDFRRNAVFLLFIIRTGRYVSAPMVIEPRAILSGVAAVLLVAYPRPVCPDWGDSHTDEQKNIHLSAIFCSSEIGCIFRQLSK
jgi:hypothetical protein